LFLDEGVYAREDGELWVCSPPIRSTEDREALWRLLGDKALEIVSTDHNCFDREQKRASRSDFRKIPNGLPGVEARMPLMIDAAIGGRLDWRAVVRLTAEAPARAMRLWPQKGAISVGADADFIVVDPSATAVLGPAHMATDYSPFDGMEVRGEIKQTWLRGHCLVRDGELVPRAAEGRYQRVQPADNLKRGAYA
jgi:dihydropyrimidinase